MMRIIFFLFFILLYNVLSAEYNSYIIKFKPNTEGKIESLEKQFNSNFSKKFNFEDYFSNPSNLSASQLGIIDELNRYYVLENLKYTEYQGLKADRSIEIIEPNYIYKIENDRFNDEFYTSQWPLKQVDAERAWNIATGKGVIVGFVDTGIDHDHPDLKDNLWVNSAEDINNTGYFENWPSNEVREGVTGDINGIDEDGNGFADDVIGFDFVDQKTTNFGDYQNPDPTPEDEGEHGTIVSGLLGATANNEIGIAGLAYEAKILTAKAFDATGNAETDDVAAAIIYAVNNGAQVLNFSFGERYPSTIMIDAIRYAFANDVVMFSSSGNNNWFFAHYPSDYPEVICVGGSNEDRFKFPQSNYGAMLDFVAPGQEIRSTNIFSSYKITNGTSLSSPYASSVAAMLLELNPELKPESIRGILRATSIDVGDIGWDEQFGAGILNAYNAVSSVGETNISFNVPDRRFLVNKDETPILTLTGNILTPLFDKYKIKSGFGEINVEFEDLTTDIFEQIKNDTIIEIDISQLQDTLYTFAIDVSLKNTNNIEERIVVEVVSGENNLTIEEYGVVDVYQNELRKKMFFAKTNRDAFMQLEYIDESADTLRIAETSYSSRTHEILIDGENLNSENFSARLKLSDRFGNEIVTGFEEYSMPESAIESYFYRNEDYTMPRTYLLNKKSDLYNNGEEVYSANDLSGLNIGNAFTFKYDNGNLTALDTLENGFIPVSFGDSNNDGIQEVLTIANFQTAIYQIGSGDSPFENEIFKSNPESIYWGEHFYDIDLDGIDEVIGYDSKSYFVAKFQNGDYSKIASATLPDPYNNQSPVKSSALGDFDNDGLIELAHSNPQGNLFIFEYSNGSFRLEKIFEEDLGSGNQYIASGDFDDDSIDEIAHLSYGGNVLFDIESIIQVWTLRFVEYDNTTNEFVEKGEKQHFYGVRSGFIPRLGISYRNGLSSGDIDGVEGDELIATIFPNMYAFKFNEGNTPEPILYFPNALSNAALIDDIDGDGKVEIGISTFNNTQFLEIEPSIKKPVITKAFFNNEGNLNIDWFFEQGEGAFEIYYFRDGDENLTQLETVEVVEPSLDYSESLDWTLPNGLYLLTVASVINDVRVFSDFVSVINLPVTEPLNAEFIDKNTVAIHYNEKMQQGQNSKNDIFLLDNDRRINSVYAYSAGDSIVYVKFPEIELTDSDYNLSVGILRDYFGNETSIGNFSISLEEVETEDEIYIEKLEVLASALLKIKYSAPVDSTTAEDVNNYVFQPFGSLFFAQTDVLDSSSVLLNIDPDFRRLATKGDNFTITVYNVKAKDGTPITTGPGNTIGFVFSAPDLQDIYVYPNPIKQNEDDRIFFGNLTARATVKVYTLDGEELISLEEQDGNGGVEWDGRDRWGNKLQEGIYIYEVTGSNVTGEEVKGEFNKFMVVP